MIDARELAAFRRIAGRANPRIKEWSGLADRDNRDRLGLTIAEGATLIGEALSRGGAGLLAPEAFVVSDSGAARPAAGALARRAADLGLALFSLADDCFARISCLKNPEGLALLLRHAGDEPDIRALLAAPGAKWLAAAGVQDPGNAGALARTALAAGMTGCLYLDGVDPHSPKFLRGAMGASLVLPCLAAPTGAFVAACRSAGPRLVVAAARPECRDFRTVDYSPPLAIVVGGERGVPEELGALPHAKARIPLHGGVDSLNLAVAAGIVLFEAERQWRRLP